MEVNPISSDPLLVPNIRRKDLIPLTVVVQYVLAKAVTEALQQWGADIRRLGRISRKSDTRRSIIHHQIRAQQVAGERNQIVSGPTRSGASLPTSLYLGHRLLLATPA